MVRQGGGQAGGERRDRGPEFLAASDVEGERDSGQPLLAYIAGLLVLPVSTHPPEAGPSRPVAGWIHGATPASAVCPRLFARTVRWLADWRTGRWQKPDHRPDNGVHDPRRSR